jgi:uncharacterized protein YjiS (DUF1127 family)
MPHVDTAMTAFSLPRLSCGLDAARSLIRRVVRVFMAWHERHRLAADDAATLANMNDRELLDIGLPRASVRAALQRAWLRDPLR